MIFKKLEDAIVQLDELVPHQLCDIIRKYIDWRVENKLLTHNPMMESHRKVNGHTLNKDHISDFVHFGNIQNVITKAYMHYKFKFPQILTESLNQIDILRYEKGDEYKWHSDNHATAPRLLSAIVNLNDDYEGGDLVFGYQNLKDEMKRVALKKGSIVFFPSSFLYPHKIEPITKGKRYSAVLWLK